MNINGNVNDIIKIGKFWYHKYFWLNPTKERCDTLAMIHTLNIKELSQNQLVELIRVCDRAITSYTNCTGYAKHWKHFRKTFSSLLFPSTKMYVDRCIFRIDHIPEILISSNTIGTMAYEKLIESRNLYDRLCDHQHCMAVTTLYAGALRLQVNLGDRKAPSDLVLRYDFQEYEKEVKTNV